MLDIGKPVAKGEGVYAVDHNVQREQLRRALQVTATGDLKATQTADGLILALMADKGDLSNIFTLARITRVYGADPDVAENIRYDVRGVFKSAAVMTNVYPLCGRPVKAAQASIARIRPASVGALCFIARNRQADGSDVAELWFPGTGGVYEGLSVKKCGGSSDPVEPIGSGDDGGVVNGGDEDLPVSGGVVGRGWSGVMSWLRG